MINSCLKKTFPTKENISRAHRIFEARHQKQVIKQWDKQNGMKRESIELRKQFKNQNIITEL